MLLLESKMSIHCYNNVYVINQLENYVNGKQIL